SAMSLLTGGPGPILIEVDRPILQLGRGEDGKLRWPEWKAAGAKGAPRALQFALRVRDAALRTPDSIAGIEGLNLDALAFTDRPLRVEVHRLSWTRGP